MQTEYLEFIATSLAQFTAIKVVEFREISLTDGILVQQQSSIDN